jgi:hypothetical protein
VDAPRALLPLRGAGVWLLVRPRTDLTRTPPQNAVVYTAEGARRRSFAVGDAVEDVQTGADDTIWVSYLDEGVFGGDDLSNNGLVTFDPDGTLVLRYGELAAAHGRPRIADCYALNVTPAGDVWLFYDDDFPLVRLRDRRLDRDWRLRKGAPVIGSPAVAVAVAGDRALFMGGYDRRDRLYLVALDAEAPDGLALEEAHAVDDRGVPLAPEHRWGEAFARGSVLYLRTVTDLVAVDVATIARG